MKRFTYFFLLFSSINIMTYAIKPIEINNIKSINIIARFIDLHIDSYDGNKILIKQLSGNKDDKNINIFSSINKNALNIDLINHSNYKFYRSKVKVNISIPSNYITQYNIDSENSTLDIQNILGNIVSDNINSGISFENLKGNFAIKTSNKVIYLANIIGDIDVKGDSSKVITKNTDGILNIVTSNKKIDIKNASVVNSISTSDASIYADFKNITQTSKIVTNDHSITITIPNEHKYSFSIFGDLIKVKNNFDNNSNNYNNFLILGTSNANIRIKSRD